MQRRCVEQAVRLPIIISYTALVVVGALLHIVAHCGVVSLEPPAQLPFSQWGPAASLSAGVRESTGIFFNDSLLNIGGCTTLDCRNFSAAMELISSLDFDHAQVEDGGAQRIRSTPLPLLPFPVAGRHAAVLVSGLVYVVRSCSIAIPLDRGSRPGTGIFSDDTTGRDSTVEVQTDYGMIVEYDPATGDINESFFEIPPPFVRVNASCVNIASLVYLVGGFNASSGEGLTTIDALDVLSMTFYANVTTLDVPLSNPSVATDFTSLYIGGGALRQPHGRDDEPVMNRMVWRVVPSIGGASTCVELFPLLPSNFSAAFAPPANLTVRPSPFALSIVPFAGFVTVINGEGSRVAMLRTVSPVVETTWVIWDWNASASSVSMHHDDFQTGAEPRVVSPVATGSSTVFLASAFKNPGTNVSESRLLVYRLGGVDVVREAVTDNSSMVVYALSSNVSFSVALNTLTLPSNTLHNLVVQSGIVQFAMSGTNNLTMALCVPPKDEPPVCIVRLSSRMDCIGNAAGTFDSKWNGEKDVIFSPTGASYPVFVCFSFGQSSKDTCGGLEVPSTFYNTDTLSPIDIVDVPPTPPPTTAAPRPSDSNLSTLLYVLGGVALLTTLVAVLLVSRLRRVPDEGLIHDRQGSPVSGYQEERYKVLGKIGEGAFSTVYLVQRKADGVRFAMKHMECQSDVQRQEAIKECEIMRSLQGHPNVIRLFDMFMNYEFDRGQPSPTASANAEAEALLRTASHVAPKPKLSRHLCLVMEYHPAGDLRRWALNHRGPVAEPILCSVAFQVTSVLKHIHAQDPAVIHRDLKPENILIVSLDEDQEVTKRGYRAAEAAAALDATFHAPGLAFLPIVLTDFGLARIQEGTYCASGAGTLPYVAPECFKKKYTTQCDMWSLGCVLYAVATKRCSHDNVRLMFQDCELPDFKASITQDLVSCSVSELMIAFILNLIERDPKKRSTADQAFKLFRKKGDVVYLSQRAFASSKQLRGTTAEETQRPEKALASAREDREIASADPAAQGALSSHVSTSTPTVAVEMRGDPDTVSIPVAAMNDEGAVSSGNVAAPDSLPIVPHSDGSLNDPNDPAGA